MVDPERLHRMLRRVTDDLAVLRGYAAVEPDELLADPVRLGHVKYLFVTVLEGCVDTAQHVCASEGFGPPSTNAEAMLLLGKRGVLPTSAAQVLAEAVRFRNVLVHGYVDVDDRRVVGHLQRLDDLYGFADAVARLL